MPLTNPNKIVTEERLSEFYGQILPYMGGMPEMVANKFSKSCIYSTTERMVGQWYNGKPIYQKTVITNTNTTTPMSDIADNVEEVVHLEFRCGWKYGSEEAWYYNTNYKNSDNGFRIGVAYKPSMKLEPMPYSYTNNKELIATLWYTKTTDSPIAIGSDTDYSTDEKIVGTWIDGSPVWQKTVATGGNVPSGATLILRTAMASTGYDTILYTK